MKTKRFLSILLALALCLGLLPGTTLAETVEINEATGLPTGYAQMYAGEEDSATSYSIEAGGSRDVNFYAKSDGEYILLNGSDTKYEITCVSVIGNIGEVGPGKNGTNWRAGSAIPGSTGYIYADNGDFKYALPVSVDDPLIGAYTKVPDMDNLADGYVPAGKGSTYTIEYTPSTTDAVVAYICTGLREDTVNWTIKIDNSVSTNSAVSASLSDDAKTLSVTLAANQTGTVESTISLYVNDDTEAETFKFVFSDSTESEDEDQNQNDNEGDNSDDIPDSPAAGLYTTLSGGQLSGSIEMTQFGSDGPHGYSVTYTRGQSMTVYYYNPERTCTFSGAVDISGSKEMKGVYVITLPEGKSGTIEVGVTLTHSDGSDGGGFPIRFTDGTNASDGQENKRIEAHELKNEEKWTGTVSHGDMGPAPFVYKGVTYLVGAGGQNPSFYSSGTKDWNEVEDRGYHVGFWTTDKQGNYFKVTDTNLISELNNAFNSTMTLALYAAELNGEYPEYYPACKIENGGMSYTFNNQNSGMWIFVLTGTITDELAGAQQVTALVRDVIEFEETLVYQAKTVDEVNAIIAGLAEVTDVKNYTIELAPVDMYGTIKIEDLAARLPITFQGTVSEDGTEHTVLHGGICVNAGGHIFLEDLELVGCGKYKSVWGQNEYGIDPEAPNCGLYGTAIASYANCTFRDFDIAVKCVDGLRWGRDDTKFLNNRIGLYMDREIADGGSLTMDGFLFQNNDVAIYLEKMGTSKVLPMSVYVIRRTKFIGNGVDVVNRTGKWFFLPGNYFVKEVGPVFTATDPFSATTFALDTAETTYVSAFPYAVSEDFKELIYEENAVVSNTLAKDWLIPEESLTQTTITVIDDTSNEEAAIWTFGSSTEEE